MLVGEALFGLERQSYQRRVDRCVGQPREAWAVAIDTRRGKKIVETRGRGTGREVQKSAIAHSTIISRTFVVRLV